MSAAAAAISFSLISTTSAFAWTNPSVSPVLHSTDFNGLYTENFESYSQNQNSHHLFASGDSIFGGHATMSTIPGSGEVDPFTGKPYPGNSNSLLRTFNNTQDLVDGWGTGRDPQFWNPNGGSYGLGVGIMNNDPSGMYDAPLTITFDPADNLHYFGGYFGTGGSDFKVRFRFLNAKGEVIGATHDSKLGYDTAGDIDENFGYGATSTSDWKMKWYGYSTTEAIAKVQISGYFMVMDDLKAAVVPEPATIAILSLGVAAATRRRRK